MSYSVRKANRDDVQRLEQLLTDYMWETYQGAWGGSAELLERHLTENVVEILLAETPFGEAVAFLAWSSSYDLHWCMKGGVIIDLFVSPQHRSRGVAVLLATDLAKQIQDCGGTHLKGGAVESPIVHRLYQRIAMRLSDNEYYVSGRAFRHLANLSGEGVREIVKNLPETAWNYEP
ncbi:MAG: GNAT family N-acetyltransferase [Pyrinomonadaceae bacterium]